MTGSSTPLGRSKCSSTSASPPSSPRSPSRRLSALPGSPPTRQGEPRAHYLLSMAFTKRTLSFFRQLARHNEKSWFEAHRDIYENDVRAPMRELIEDLDTRFAEFAPEIGGDPRRSMFRIYRDIRFSKDKSPYKTH